FLTIPTDTEEGWLCWQVVQSVRSHLYREPDRAAAAVARLEAEFFAALRERGAIRLPGPDAVEPIGYVLAKAREALPRPGRRAGRPAGPARGGHTRRQTLDPAHAAPARDA